MTRERLWKRLLYGTQLPSTSDRNKKVNSDQPLSMICTTLYGTATGSGEANLFRVLFITITSQCVSTGHHGC